MIDERPNNCKTIDINNLRQSEALSKKVLRGGIWAFALRIISRGLGFIRTIILARLLAPSDFGLLGIAMLAISTVESFSQTGFQAALIQKKENVESYVDTAWTVSVIRGAVLFLILFLSAPIIAKFFNSPQATLVIKVIAISTLLSGLRNIAIISFQKELEFNKQFFYELSATLTDLSVSITLAFMLRNVWALVWGGLAGHLVRFVLSYVLHHYRPMINIKKDKLEELFGFGKWVAGSAILFFLVTQVDDIFVGKMLGVTALGLYQMAYLISNLSTTEISYVTSQVAFPAYSKLQYDLPRLGHAYVRVLEFTAFLSIPFTAAVFILASDFTHIFLGDKWMPMIPTVQILAFSGLARCIGATTAPVFRAVNRPKVETKWKLLRLTILVTLIYPFCTYWGISGIAIAVLFSTLLSMLGIIFTLLKMIHPSLRLLCKIIILPFLNTTLMVTIILLLKYLIPIPNIGHFILFIIVGTITYLVITYLFKIMFTYNPIVMVKTI